MRLPPRDLLALAAAVRLLCALLTRTYGAPDEHWQGPEVAHALAFGPGARTWEWAPGTALRSHAHPLLLALLAYAPVRALEAGARAAGLLPAAAPLLLRLLWLAPRLVHAAATLAGDAATYALALRLHGERAARLALLAQLCNFFSLWAAARPLSNGLEAALCTLALVQWREAVDAAAAGGSGSSGKPRGCANRPAVAAAALGALAVALRPTAAVYLALMALVAAPRLGGVGGVLRLALSSGALAAGAAALAALAALDSLCYGRPTLPALNFLAANALRGVGSLYGTHGGAWYLHSGLPMLMGAQLVPVGVSLAALRGGPAAARNPYEGALIAAGVTAALSAVAHKEHRFLLPVLPLLSVHAGHGLALLLPERRGGAGAAPGLRRRALLLAAVLAAAAASIAAALYLSLVHQRGAVAVAESLALRAAAAAASGAPMVVHFLTPCHATPLFSHLHAPRLVARTLECHPASMAGAPGGGFLEGLCAQGGCCGAWARGGPAPGLWESRALQAAPLALLHSVYGRGQGRAGGQRQPAACRVEEGGGWRRRRRRRRRAGRRCCPSLCLASL